MGGDGDWRTALAGFPVAVAPWSIGLLGMGIIAMTTKTRILAAVAVLLMMIGSYIFWPETARLDVPPADGLPDQIAGVAATAHPPDDGPQDKVLDGKTHREAIAPMITAVAPRGTLLVRVVWSDDTPAEDVAVALQISQSGVLFRPLKREVSDQRGLVRFPALSPGTFSVYTQRAGYRASVESTVTAGETVEARLEIPVGVDVHGVVVGGDGTAIADAGIWLTSGATDWLGGRIVTRSDTRGEFRIRGAQRDASLGAIVAGFTPSPLVDLDALDTARSPVLIRLTVQEPGGGIEGTITAPSGDPVAGAVVCVGVQPQRFKQRRGSMSSRVEKWTPLIATTDLDGHYALRGVAPGEHPIHVRAEALALFQARITIEAGANLRRNIQLVAGCLVHGIVRDGAGKPVAAAVLRSFDRALAETYLQIGQIDYKSVFGYEYAVSDAEGRYRLPHLTPGTKHLYAMRGKRRARGKAKIRAKTVVETSDGAETEWNPVLQRGNTIVGVATYRDGEPMKNHFISARNDKTGLSQTFPADSEGRFEFVNMELAHHSLGVQYWFAPKGTPPLEKKKVWPNGGEVRLVAAFDSPTNKPHGKVRGRLQDAAGRVATGSLSVLLQSDRNYWHTEQEPKDGTFEFERVKPGKFKVVALSGETVIHVGPWFELGPSEERDVGTLVTEPGGSVDIRIHRAKGTEDIEPTISLRCPNTKHSLPVRPGRKNSCRAENLSQGKHRVIAYGTGMMTIWSEVMIEAGVVATLELRLRAAAECPLEVTLPTDRNLGAVTFSVIDSEGKSCWSLTEPNVGAIPNPYKRKPSLAPGRYVLSVKSTTGLQGERDFEVKDSKADQPVVRLTVK